MNRRRRSKRHTELLTEKLHSIQWKKLPSNIKSACAGINFPLPLFHRRALMVLVPVTLIVMLIPLPSKTDADQQQSSSSSQRVTVAINTKGLSEQGASQVKKIVAKQAEQKQEWIEYKVQSGDTLANVFRNNDLSMTELNALAKIEGADKPLSRIRQGQLVRFKLRDDGGLDILQLEKGNDSIMFFRLSDGGFARSK